MAGHDIVVVGGSAGSGPVLRTLVEGLPADLPAAVLIVTHMPTGRISHLAEMLGGKARMPVVEAIDGLPIQPGRIHVATPDRHLLIVANTLRLGGGPRENMARPAIDPLFRSAALAAGGRVIGLILSGMLNDGAAGLSAIHRRGGLSVVQHPVDADHAQMPLEALESVSVDHVAPASDLAALITRLVAEPAGSDRPVWPGLELEVEIGLGARLGSERLRQIADPVTLTCPDCDGVLSEIRGESPLRYRCQIGHAFTAEVVADATERIDEAIRLAMRIMEERVELVTRMARDARDSGRTAVAELYEKRAEEYGHYAANLREAAVAALGLDPRRTARSA